MVPVRTDLNSEQFYQQDFSAEKQLLDSIRNRLLDPGQKITVPEGLNFSFTPAISITYITLFQTGVKSIRWGSRKKTFAETLEWTINKLRSNKRFSEFKIDDPESCRILFEIVIEENPCEPRQLTTLQLTKNRLEPGIHGLKFTYKGSPYYFMPTDAVTNSLMTINQIFNYLAKRTGVAKQTNRISERVKLMRSMISDYKLIKSFACITFEDNILPLYRGYPMPVNFDRRTVLTSMISSTNWILGNMKDNGQFLYYYDGIKDSEVDFQHPHMTDPTYYNILRHSGGTIALLRAFELTDNPDYLKGAKKSVDFLLTVMREHEYKGCYACYPFFNKKSKLGGAGIGLVSLIQYQRLSGDEQYRKYIDGLVYHILSRVSETGELIGYFIHPLFNGGHEIIDPDEETKKELFSFYYPGEAMLGLVLYLQHMDNIEPELRKLILEKSKLAMDFLIHERPKKYHYMFDPLPSDGWLMQAIEEWVKIDGFNDNAYIDFVFNDAQAMIDHMYQENNSPFLDYPGSFYYKYGEHAYPDGARCEGLVAAYYLAVHLQQEQLAKQILHYLLKAARGLMYTLNTPESCYAHKRPDKSINSFRFKFTRQWVRVDSVQHTACFFARLYPHIPDVLPDKTEAKYKSFARIDGYTIIKTLKKGGFATAYLVCDPVQEDKKYVIKKLLRSRYNFNRIQREINALKIMNEYGNSVKCYRSRMHGGELYFLFEYAPDGDLEDYILKNGRMDEQTFLSLTTDLLDEIQYAKERNLFHFDITIYNVILYKNKFSLIDWGLAINGPTVRTSTTKGHRTYLPPETYNGERTFASEIYSLGATLYFAATGKLIFDIDRMKTPLEEIIFKHFYSKPDIPADLSKRVAYLLFRMLEKDPLKRATVEEIQTIVNGAAIPTDYTFQHDEEAAGMDLSDKNKIFFKMAEDGICHAQMKLGTFYEEGKIFPQDLQQAVYWYAKAADKDYYLALLKLARLYLQGKGVKQDYGKAFSLLKNAAEQGHGISQYHLAKMYNNGWGTEKDQQTALSWLIESARNNYIKAAGELEDQGIDIFEVCPEPVEIDFGVDLP